MKFIYLCFALVNAINIRKSEPVVDKVYAFNENKSIKSILTENKGDFSADLFELLLTRKEISHVFLSDIDKIQNMLVNEFPEVVKLKSIGQTWNARPI